LLLAALYDKFSGCFVKQNVPKVYEACVNTETFFSTLISYNLLQACH